MKRNIYLVTIALLTLSVVGCKSDSTLDDLQFKVANNFFNTYVTLVFEDAATGEIIETGAAPPLQVSITGADQSLVVTDAGKRKNQFTVDGGLLPFNLDPYAKVPSVSQPVRLVVTVSVTGYKTVSKQIILTADGILRIPVAMIASDNLPQGVTEQKTENFAALTSGKVNSTVTGEIPGTGVSLELREGTVLKTSTGTPLEGPVSLDLTHYDTRAADPSELFPGGITGEFRAADQSVQMGYLAPGGWIDIEIKDSKGNIASQVESQTIGLTLPVNPALYVPDAHRTVQTGDKLKIMSFDEQAARWNYEGEATYGNGSAKIELVHLSTWSATAATQASNVTMRFSCDDYSNMQTYFDFNFSEATFNIAIKPANGNVNLINLFQMEGSGSASTAIPAGDYTATFTFRGTNAQSIFNLPDPVNFTVSGTQAQEVEVVLSMIDQFTVLHGSLSYQKDGADQDAVGGNVNFRFRKPGNTDWRMVTTGQQGEMSIQMEQGDYEVQVNDGGKWKPEDGPYTVTIPADRLMTFGRTSYTLHPLDPDFLKSTTNSGPGYVNLTVELMVTNAKAMALEAEQAYGAVGRLVVAARAKQEIIKVLCLGDKYNQIQLTAGSMRERLSNLKSAASQNDINIVEYEYTRINVLNDRLRTLVAESNQCFSEGSGFGGGPEVNFNGDPDDPLVDLIDPDADRNPVQNGLNFQPTPPIAPLIINTSEGTATISFVRSSPVAPTGWIKIG